MTSSRTRDASLVPGAFATLDFPPADVRVFHTDRGGGFDDTRIDEPLDVFGIKGSLPRKGNPYGNAVVESTDRLLKKELVYRNRYATVGQLRLGPDGYVWWSDGQRLHSTLGYRSPKEFTEQELVLQGPVQHIVANPTGTGSIKAATGRATCVAPHRHRPLAIPLTHQGLRRQEDPRGQWQARDHPLCQTVHRP